MPAPRTVWACHPPRSWPHPTRSPAPAPHSPPASTILPPTPSAFLCDLLFCPLQISPVRVHPLPPPPTPAEVARVSPPAPRATTSVTAVTTTTTAVTTMLAAVSKTVTAVTTSVTAVTKTVTAAAIVETRAPTTAAACPKPASSTPNAPDPALFPPKRSFYRGPAARVFDASTSTRLTLAATPDQGCSTCAKHEAEPETSSSPNMSANAALRAQRPWHAACPPPSLRRSSRAAKCASTRHPAGDGCRNAGPLVEGPPSALECGIIGRGSHVFGRGGPVR